MTWAQGSKSLYPSARRRASKARNTGFSLFELVVGIVIVGLLATMLSDRMVRYQEYAEKTAMEATARHVHTGLRLQVADLMMSDRMHEVGRLLQDNPIAWLEAPPPNYVGERIQSQQNKALRGTWYFDAARRELVYLPFHRQFFKPALPGSDSIRYRVVAIHPSADSPSERIQGLSLLLLTPYQWNVQLERSSK